MIGSFVRDPSVESFPEEATDSQLLPRVSVPCLFPEEATHRLDPQSQGKYMFLDELLNRGVAVGGGILDIFRSKHIDGFDIITSNLYRQSRLTVLGGPGSECGLCVCVCAFYMCVCAGRARTLILVAGA